MVANVSGLFIEALIIAQSMIKEVALPIHGEMASSVTFPASNRFLHSHFRSESSEQVQVIRHEDEQGNTPFVLRVIISDGSEQFFPHIIVAELIFSLWLATEGDKENGVGCPNEVRRVVR